MPSPSSNRTTPTRPQRERSRSPSRGSGSAKVRPHHTVVMSHPRADAQHAPDTHQNTWESGAYFKTFRPLEFEAAPENRFETADPAAQAKCGRLTAGAACFGFVLRASCFVLRASCPLAPFGPLTPIGTDEIRSHYLSHSSLTPYPLRYVAPALHKMLAATAQQDYGDSYGSRNWSCLP